MKLVTSGHFLDRIFRDELLLDERAGRNAVTYRSLDLVAGLLGNQPELRGVLYWAVGSGDAGWDADLPVSSPLARTLTNEVYRKPIDSLRDVQIDAETNALILQLNLAENEAVGDTLREFGIFGGDASARPNSGYLLNHAIHAAIERVEGDVLEREVRLSFGSDQAPAGLIELIPRLLANEPGLSGIRHFAIGSGEPAWDAEPPTEDLTTRHLEAEIYREAVQPWRDIRYDAELRTLLIDTQLEFDEAPAELREYALFAGDSLLEPDSGYLISYQIEPVLEHQVATRLNREFRIVLSAGDLVDVPDLEGRSLEEAETELQAAELILGTITESVRAEELAGTIIDQGPEAGASVERGTTVDISVAIQPVVIVPDLTGLTPEQASAILEDAGLALGSDEPAQREDPATPGTTVSQSPQPGAEVPVGSAISIVLAIPQTVSVPDLAGFTPGETEVMLRKFGLALMAGPYPTAGAEIPYNVVTSQEPAAGERAERGSIVTITISAPWTVVVPDLSGMILQDAETALREAGSEVLETIGDQSEQPGLAIGSQVRAGSDATPGTVISQSPAAGQRAPLFGTVDLTIARPEIVDLPDLRGLSQPEALELLGNTGLGLLRTVTRKDVASPGTVVGQEPRALARIERGSAVTLYLSEAIDVRVPDLVGRSIQYATEVLAGRGLILAEPVREVSEEPVDTVIRQDPAAGVQAALGSSVSIVVSTAAQVEAIRGAVGSEPDTLYLYGSDMLPAIHILQSLYDGPVDTVGFEDQPVIFGERPFVDSVRVQVRLGQIMVANGQVMRSRMNTTTSSMRVRFQLADGLTWSDGQPVTAKDSVFAFNVASDPATPVSKFRIRRTARYEAIDERTVEWTGLPGWLDASPLRNFWTPLPGHILDGAQPGEIFRGDFRTKPVGYGPFQIEAWNEGEEIELSRHPSYFLAGDGFPLAGRLTFSFRDSDATFAALRGGDIDFALNGSLGLERLPDLQVAQDAGELRLLLEESTAQQYLVFCQDEQRTPFFMNAQVRQAIAFALDRDTMARELSGGRIQPAHSFIPPSHPMHLRDMQRFPFDPVSARRLLATAGFEGGFGVELLVPDGRTDRLKLADMIVAFLDDVGITVNVEVRKARELFAKGEEGPLYSRRFEMVLMEVDFGSEPPARMLLSEEISARENGFGGPNLSGYRNAEFDAAALGALASSDRQQQFDFWSRAQKIFGADLPIIPLFTQIRLAATRPEFSGLSLDSSSISEMSNVERFRP